MPLPPTSHVEMTSRHLLHPVWSTAVRIPTLQSGAELLPSRHNSIVKSLMSQVRDFLLPLTTLLMHAFYFIQIIVQLFYKVSYFVISLCSWLHKNVLNEQMMTNKVEPCFKNVRLFSLFSSVFNQNAPK